MTNTRFWVNSGVWAGTWYYWVENERTGLSLLSFQGTNNKRAAIVACDAANNRHQDMDAATDKEFERLLQQASTVTRLADYERLSGHSADEDREPVEAEDAR